MDVELSALAELGRLTLVRPEAVTAGTVLGACEIVRDVLDADDAYVICAGDPHFVRVGCAGDPAAYEIKQKGYYLVWEQLALHPDIVGGLFNMADRRVYAPNPLVPGIPATHLAVLLPSEESNSEMLIVRGPWPHGLRTPQIEFLVAARPILATLASMLLDKQRRQRQQEQLRSLSVVAATLVDGQDIETALGAIATAVAKAASFDVVTINLLSPDLSRVTTRVLNRHRYSDTKTTRIGAKERGYAVHTAAICAETYQPLLYPDVSATDHPYPLDENARRFFVRAHILSHAVFPLWSGERLLGTVEFSSSAPHSFTQDEVEYLALLCEQIVMAVTCLQLQREIREANAALARAAVHDALTGLPNRALFLDRLQQALARAQRTRAQIAVLFIDLDNFKGVNDSLGHEAGDRLLRIVAERLQSNMRAGDTVARLGGDEFTALLDGVASQDEALQVAWRLQTAIHQPAEIAERMLRCTASIGVAMYSDGVTAEGLIRMADAAMYRAKAAGKVCVSLYDVSRSEADTVQRPA